MTTDLGHMAAEQPATTPATTVPAAEKEPVAANSPAAADPIRWEFRLTADRRRILVQVNPTSDPEVV